MLNYVDVRKCVYMRLLTFMSLHNHSTLTLFLQHKIVHFYYTCLNTLIYDNCCTTLIYESIDFYFLFSIINVITQKYVILSLHNLVVLNFNRFTGKNISTLSYSATIIPFSSFYYKLNIAVKQVPLGFTTDYVTAGHHFSVLRAIRQEP